MWWSLVATTWSYVGASGVLRRPGRSSAPMSAATRAPPGTGSEPPSQKSFCTSVTISARFMLAGYRSLVDGRDDRLAPRHLLDGDRAARPARRGGGRGRPPAARARRPRRRAPAAPAAAGRRRRRPARWPMPTTSASATPAAVRRRSAYLRPPTETLSTLFFATDTISPVAGLAGDQLVDEAAGRVAAAGDQLGADAVPVDRRRRQRRDRELVEVAGHDDPGPGRAQRVELGAHLRGRAPRGRPSRCARRRARCRRPRPPSRTASATS